MSAIMALGEKGVLEEAAAATATATATGSTEGPDGETEEGQPQP